MNRSPISVLRRAAIPRSALDDQEQLPAFRSAEVVPNPNAGGVGVPISVWMNANASCPGEVGDRSQQRLLGHL